MPSPVGKSQDPGNFERLEIAGLVDKTTTARRNFEKLKARVRTSLPASGPVEDLILAQPGVKADLYKRISGKDLPLLATLQADQALKFQSVDFIRALHTSFWDKNSLHRIHRFISIQTAIKSELSQTAVAGTDQAGNVSTAKSAGEALDQLYGILNANNCETVQVPPQAAGDANQITVDKLKLVSVPSGAKGFSTLTHREESWVVGEYRKWVDDPAVTLETVDDVRAHLRENGGGKLDRRQGSFGRVAAKYLLELVADQDKDAVRSLLANSAWRGKWSMLDIQDTQGDTAGWQAIVVKPRKVNKALVLRLDYQHG